jgi:hypothetical protein
MPHCAWYACCTWCTSWKPTNLFEHAMAPKELQAPQLYLVLLLRGSLLGLVVLLGPGRRKAARLGNNSGGRRSPVQRQQAPASPAARQQHQGRYRCWVCTDMRPPAESDHDILCMLRWRTLSRPREV